MLFALFGIIYELKYCYLLIRPVYICWLQQTSGKRTEQARGLKTQRLKVLFLSKITSFTNLSDN
jgi:hypothetical protein